MRCHRLQLTDLLVAPMQHCTKLPLLLSNIRKYTEDMDERTQLTESIQTVENSLSMSLKKYTQNIYTYIYIYNFTHVNIIYINIILDKFHIYFDSNLCLRVESIIFLNEISLIVYPFAYLNITFVLFISL